MKHENININNWLLSFTRTGKPPAIPMVGEIPNLIISMAEVEEPEEFRPQKPEKKEDEKNKKGGEN